MIDPYALGLTVTGIGGNEAYCLCPFHDDHTRSASFNLMTGKFHCFACGENSNAERLAKYLGGIIAPFDEAKARRYVGESTKDWEWVMSCKHAFSNKYLYSRKIDDYIVDRYDIREFGEGVAFIMYDIKGTPCGAQLRFYEGNTRYLTIGKKPQLWPFNKLKPRQGQIVFVEGVFGALNARRYGVNAYAVLGVHSAVNAVNIANGFRRKTLVFDNDEAGKVSACKILGLRLGFEAYCPGAEADEEPLPFWNSVITGGDRFMIDYHDMAASAGVTRESWAAIQKFIVQRKRMIK